ncbi:MAG TPA: LETM1 domain-containing protein [Myxococcaceae bacterium]|nr:LETM1 domain-containing protein [Myxococcaceae bacterium]
MDLGSAGWLRELLEKAVASHDAERVRRGEGIAWNVPPRARARAWLRQQLRHSGLLFGTPREVESAPQGSAPEVVLFLAVLRTFATLALDAAAIVGAPTAPREQQLLVLFGALTGQFDEAEAVARQLGSTSPDREARRAWSRVESAVEERAMSLAGDPAYGLVLHNGAVYVDALALGRQAIGYFGRGHFHRRSAERRCAHAARYKAALVEVLTALVCAERQPSFPTRRAILRQIEDLHLPGDIADELRGRVKRYFERRPSSEALIRTLSTVRSGEGRGFLLAQAMLAARVDGRTSPEERSFLASLAQQLGFGPDELKRLEVEVAEFYARNRSVVDVFTVSAAGGVIGQEVLDSLQSALEKNFQRLMTEIRETGELSVLLSRAARGQTLTREERKRMRAQLIDVAKAIPALAIFAAPGGVLLLIALAKVLPFSLLPSAFTDDSEGDDEIREGEGPAPSGKKSSPGDPAP